MTLAEFRAKVRATIKEFQNDFHDVVKDILGGSLTFVSALAAGIAANGGKLFEDIVDAAVRSAEATGKSGSEKFDDAKAEIISILKTKGMDIVINNIHGAISAAVATLHAEQEKSEA